MSLVLAVHPSPWATAIIFILLENVQRSLILFGHIFANDNDNDVWLRFRCLYINIYIYLNGSVCGEVSASPSLCWHLFYGHARHLGQVQLQPTFCTPLETSRWHFGNGCLPSFPSSAGSTSVYKSTTKSKSKSQNKSISYSFSAKNPAKSNLLS